MRVHVDPDAGKGEKPEALTISWTVGHSYPQPPGRAGGSAGTGHQPCPQGRAGTQAARPPWGQAGRDRRPAQAPLGPRPRSERGPRGGQRVLSHPASAAFNVLHLVGI